MSSGPALLLKVLKRVAKSGVRRLAAALGYAIIRTDSSVQRCTMARALRAIARRGHTIDTVIDIGASDGRWSSDLMRYYPSSRYLLIEAQPVHEAALRAYCTAHPNAQFVLAAAGEKSGRAYFDASDPFGGKAAYERSATATLEVPMISVDDAVAAGGLRGPFLLKFDTHGFEFPILNGATKTLQETEVIVMECYNFRIAPECLTFDEMCQHLRRIGFRCIDVADPLYRPTDDSLWQMDLVFIRESRPEFANASYD